MNAPRVLLVCSALALAVAGSACHRPASKEEVKQTASRAAAEIKTQSAEARDRFNDAWITTKIKSKLVGDSDIKARDIDVATADGVVTLKGHVLNEPLRRLAETLAKNTDGVTQVVNQLQTQIVAPVPARAQNAGTPGAVATSGTADASAPIVTESNDARVTSAVQSKFFTDDRIKVRHINVASSNGVVTLSGEVADDTERAQALLLARTTDGVTRVEDSLTVTTNQPAAYTQPTAAAPGGAASAVTSPKGDDALSAKVQSQLSADSRVKGAAIEVSAKNGVVLLQGSVASAAAKQRALTLARGTDGVSQVVDRIAVGKAKK
jgi:osmotically-inducible protein OsmY